MPPAPGSIFPGRTDDTHPGIASPARATGDEPLKPESGRRADHQGKRATNANGRTGQTPMTPRREGHGRAGGPRAQPSRGPPRSRSVQREHKIARWRRQRLPYGRTKPFNGERTERMSIPGTPPRITEPNRIAKRRDRSEKPRDRSFVEGRPSGVIVEGAEAQPTPPMGPTPHYGTQFLCGKNGKPEPPELPRKGGPKGDHSHLRPHPLLIPRDPPDWDHPCAPFQPAPTNFRLTGETLGRNRCPEYLAGGRRCQAAIHHPPLIGRRTHPSPERKAVWASPRGVAAIDTGGIGGVRETELFQTGKSTRFLRPD